MKRLVSFFVLLFLFSCGDGVEIINTNDQDASVSDSLRNETEKTAKIIEPILDDEIIFLENKGISLREIKSVYNPNASLQLETVRFKEGLNVLDFSIEGIVDYKISTIENNYTISQHDKNNIEKEFLYGNNVFLAFLTDSEGVSLKTNKGHVLKNVTFSDEPLFDMAQPHLFYYLPAIKSEKTILDFYLVNTSISENGNRVKVTINDAEFVLTKWAAYQITGLKSSENTIRIQLLDEKANLIEGPFNDSGDRKF